MKYITDTYFTSWESEIVGNVYQNITFEKCTFQGIRMKETDAPSNRSHFKNVTFLNCFQTNCTIQQGIFDNVTINNLYNKSLLQTWGALFKNCVLTGKIGHLMLSENTVIDDKILVEKFQQSSKEFYADIDWAIDISKAEFLEFDNRSIPAKLIKRDPETQVVIKRDKLLEFGKFEELVDYEATRFFRYFELFLRRKMDDKIIIAPKMNKKDFAMNLRVINRLVEAGIAER